MTHVSRGKRRCYLTHVAFICDRADIQPLLPQVIIGNEATFAAGQLVALKAMCPPHVHLLRQKSAWNNEVTCAAIVRLLRDALAPLAHTVQPILLLDAARLHTTRLVLSACNRACVWPILVPAGVTWLLQPLDTHVFLRFKLFLSKSYQRARARTVDGDLNIMEFLPCICEAIRSVMQGNSWASAFDQDGFGDAQRRVSAFVSKCLEIDGAVEIPTDWPSLEMFQLCFPRRTRVPLGLLWAPFRPLPARPPLRRSGPPLPIPPPPPPPSPPPPSPVLEPRTRGDHRRAAEATARADASAASTSSAASAAPLCAHGRTWGTRHIFCPDCRLAASAGAARVFGRTRSETRRLTALAAKATLLRPP